MCACYCCGYAAISIHAAREGGDCVYVLGEAELTEISIHAAREGGDCNNGGGLVPTAISIHAAREGGDL